MELNWQNITYEHITMIRVYVLAHVDHKVVPTSTPHGGVRAQHKCYVALLKYIKVLNRQHDQSNIILEMCSSGTTSYEENLIYCVYVFLFVWYSIWYWA